MAARITGTTPLDDAVELAMVTRGDFIESRHAGSAIVLSPSGETLVTLGDPSRTVLTRSAAKPLQSLAMHLNGLQLANQQQRALSLASHTGTAEHLRLVQHMLEDGDLSEHHLGCPPAYPEHEPTLHAMIRECIGPRKIAMTCSGKHAAMLRTCVANHWDIESYLDPDHPLQQAVADTLQRYSGERPMPATIDGCGAPVFGLTLHGLARAYRRLSTADAASPFPVNRLSAQLFAAGRAHPELVEGPGGHDTVAMQTTGVFAKYGAEGISAMAAPDGSVAVVKVLDGSLRAARPIALSLLAYTGAIPKSALATALQRMNLQVRGGAAPVGEVRVSIPALSSR